MKRNTRIFPFFIGPSEEIDHVNGGPRMEVCQIGNLVKNLETEEITHFNTHAPFSDSLLVLGLFSQNKRSLTDKEMEMVKRILLKPENKFFIAKIKKDIGILPALK